MNFETNLQSQIKDPKQKRLLIVALVLFVGVGFVIYRMFFASPGGPSAPAASPAVAGTPAAGGSSAQPRQPDSASFGRKDEIERVQLDTEALKIPIFEKLTTYSRNLPLVIPTERSENPFQSRPRSPSLTVGP